MSPVSRAGVESALHALIHGDPREVRALLGLLHPEDEWGWVRVWSTTSTLYGTVCGRMTGRQGASVYPMTIEHQAVFVDGGPPREVILDECLPALREALALPPTAERHRTNARALLTRLQEAAVRHRSDSTRWDPAGEFTRWDPAVAVLRHHTDLPVDLLQGRIPMTCPADLAPEAAKLQPLAAVLEDPRAFRAHLEQGLASAPGPRRTLAEWLLALP